MIDTKEKMKHCLKIEKDIYIADGCKIGANAVVNKTCIEKDKHLVGVPAHIV